MTDRRNDDAGSARHVDPNAETRVSTPEQDNIKTRHHGAGTTGGGAEPAPASAATLGDYRILRKIGEGGMGVVYEAEQQNPHRLVALKVIRGGLHADDYHVKMFEREIEALARLKHPGIASIYESGRSDDGQVFFAMELVNGVALTDFVERRRSMSGDAAANINEQLALFAQIGDVVSHAHQRGVIHRDLKPQNVLVTGEADTMSGDRFGVKILDFGLARINDPDFRGNTGVSQVGQIKGTLLYMSPEQVRGRSDEIDVRSDVYALGVMLYEMLSGQMPYDLSQASLPEAMRIICEEPPKPLTKAFSETHGRSGRIDRDVETIALKALEKDPDRRYQSVAAMLDDVERYIRNEPITARPPSPVYQFKKLVARHKLAFASMATIFLLVAGFGAVMAAQSVRIANERDKAEQARAEADQEKREAEKSRNDALIAKNEESKQRQIAVDSLSRAEEQKTKAESAQKAEQEQRQLAENSLKEARLQKNIAETKKREAEAASEQRRLAEDRAVAKQAEAEFQAEKNRRQLYVSQMNLAEQAWEQADIARVREILLGQIPIPGQEDLRGFEWYYLWRSSHSAQWTFSSKQDLSPMAKDASPPANGRMVVSNFMSASGFSEDGRLVIVNGSGGDIIPSAGSTRIMSMLLAADTGQVLSAMDGRHILGFSSNDNLISMSGDGSIELLTLASLTSIGGQKAKIDLNSLLNSPELSPDRNLIASVSRTGKLELTDLRTGTGNVYDLGQLTVAASGLNVRSLGFSPQSSVLFIADRNRLVSFDILSGAHHDAIKSSDDDFFSIAVSPDGKYIASASLAGGIKLWDIASGRTLGVLRIDDQATALATGLTNVRFSHDGKMLAASIGRGVTFWDVRSRSELFSIRPQGELVASFALSPDGKTVVTSDHRSVSLSKTPPANPSLLQSEIGSAVSPDGKILATTSRSGTRLWNLGTQEPIVHLERQNKTYPGESGFVKFSPDGRTLGVLRTNVSLSGAGVVRFGGSGIELWDVNSRAFMGVLDAKGAGDFSWSPNSETIATLTVAPASAQLWDVNRRKMIRSFERPRSVISALANR